VYDANEINAHWNNAWPTDTSDVTNTDHEFSPVLQAPVANLLGKPWYLESGSPGGDYVTWLEVDGGGQVGVSPHRAADGIMRWAICRTDSDGNPLAQEHELPISATPEEVVARVHAFLEQHGISAD
jgi:hypothetical protein